MDFAFCWFGPNDPVPLQRFAQVPGVRSVVTGLEHVAPGVAWTESDIAARRALCNEAGLEWKVAEPVPVHDSIKAAGKDRDQHIEAFAMTVKRLGDAGITTVCYNFMPVFDWMRTDYDYLLEDGSSVISYSQKEFDALDLTHGLPKRPAWPRGFTADELREISDTYAGVTKEEYFERFEYFIRAITPVAESAGVKLSVHPDDPPWPIFGLPRIASTESEITKLLAASDSPSHGLTFCTGSLAANAATDVVGMVSRVRDRIHFTHLRNIKHRSEKEFHEVAHTRSSGEVDLVEVMAALVEIGFSGSVRPDHGRMIWGEQGKPGFGLYDRALGLMYLQGIHDALTRG